MTDQDTQATEPATADRAAEKAREAGHGGQAEDERAGSPVPDPTAAEQDADDVPGAD
jgi:hypothetical protein